MRAPALLLVPVLLMLANVASAQPSTKAPGAPHSYPHSLALPPLPFTAHSPMPSLPPPQAGERPPPAKFGSGSVLRAPGFDAHINEDGRLIFDARFLRTGLSSDPTVGPRFGGTFDLTDIFSQQDPYLREKLELLEETFEHRTQLREHHDERVMDRALADLPSYLGALWSQEDWDTRTKRRLLFALWDECAEGGAKHAKEGTVARQIIEGFIARNLPMRSHDGFSLEELRALNAGRTSTLEFAPQ